jgi:hypothetical protein
MERVSLPNLVQKGDLRVFGLLFTFVICLVGVVALLSFDTYFPIWLLPVALLLFLLAIWQPFALRIPYKAWLRFGMSLGKLNSRIILGFFFCAVFIPIGVVRRGRKVDPLCRKWDPLAPTYRTNIVVSQDNQDDMRFPY